jgi:hypothetical protein
LQEKWEPVFRPQLRQEKPTPLTVIPGLDPGISKREGRSLWPPFSFVAAQKAHEAIAGKVGTGFPSAIAFQIVSDPFRSPP